MIIVGIWEHAYYQHSGTSFKIVQEHLVFQHSKRALIFLCHWSNLIIGNVLKREWVLSFGHWWSGQQKSVHLTTWQSARRPIISDKSSFNLAASTFSFYHQQELRDWSLLKHGGGARLGWTDNYVSVQTLPALPIQDATSFNGRSEQKMKLLRGRHGQRGCNCQG